MGTVMISLEENMEKLLRNLAQEMYGGKKGAISAVVEHALEEIAVKNKRLRAARHQIALMKTGFNLGLKDKKIYSKRSEIYD